MTRSNEMKPSEASVDDRRRFVQLTGAGLATVVGAPLCHGAQEQNQSSRVLKRGDKIDIGGRGEEIIQQAYKLGYKYESEHGG